MSLPNHHNSSSSPPHLYLFLASSSSLALVLLFFIFFFFFFFFFDSTGILSPALIISSSSPSPSPTPSSLYSSLSSSLSSSSSSESYQRPSQPLQQQQQQQQQQPPNVQYHNPTAGRKLLPAAPPSTTSAVVLCSLLEHRMPVPNNLLKLTMSIGAKLHFFSPALLPSLPRTFHLHVESTQKPQPQLLPAEKPHPSAMATRTKTVRELWVTVTGHVYPPLRTGSSSPSAIIGISDEKRLVPGGPDPLHHTNHPYSP